MLLLTQHVHSEQSHLLWELHSGCDSGAHPCTVTLGVEVEQGRVNDAAIVGQSTDLVVLPLFLLCFCLSQLLLTDGVDFHIFFIFSESYFIYVMSHNMSACIPSSQCVQWQWETVWSVSKPSLSMAQKAWPATTQPCPAMLLEQPCLHLHRQVLKIILISLFDYFSTASGSKILHSLPLGNYNISLCPFHMHSKPERAVSFVQLTSNNLVLLH